GLDGDLRDVEGIEDLRVGVPPSDQNGDVLVAHTLGVERLDVEGDGVRLILLCVVADRDGDRGPGFRTEQSHLLHESPWDRLCEPVCELHDVWPRSTVD